MVKCRFRVLFLFFSKPSQSPLSRIDASPAMNGVSPVTPQNPVTRVPKPPPAGPTPPAPATAPPAPPNHANSTNQLSSANRTNPPPHNHTPGVNGHHHHAQKGKKRSDVPVDPATMYESLKNRIAALEEEEVIEEEEERRYSAFISLVAFDCISHTFV